MAARKGKRERERIRAAMAIDAACTAIEAGTRATDGAVLGSRATRKRDTSKRWIAVTGSEGRADMPSRSMPAIDDPAELAKRANAVARNRANARATGYRVNVTPDGHLHGNRPR